MENIGHEPVPKEAARPTGPTQRENRLRVDSGLPRIAMVSIHGYVAANPPLGAVDTGGQVVYVLELSKKLAQLGYEVDIWTRRFEEQPEIDVINERVRVIGVPCGDKAFLPKEYLYLHLPEWTRNALRFIKKHGLKYAFINSHYWDAGVASQRLAEVMRVAHLHTPHSLGIWKKRQMEQDHPDDAANFEKHYNFSERIHHERLLYSTADLVIATTPQQTELLVQDYGLNEEQCPMIPAGYDDHRFYPVSEASRQMAAMLGYAGHRLRGMQRAFRRSS
jgi:mannosylfructose-phosphate synthase